ncbi:MAG: hypothetical protein JWM19_16 [Actinomycetia bacterium]|nr:hypothetical protein [Actinomycetes bacterium]
MDALVRLPGEYEQVLAASTAVVTGLCRFIEAWDALSPGLSKRVTPDIQAALTLIGTVPYNSFRLENVVLVGADLTGLDLNTAQWDRVAIGPSEISAKTIEDVTATGTDGTRVEIIVHGLAEASGQAVPARPRSASTTWTWPGLQPSATARPASSYCRSRLSVFARA